MRRDGCEEIVKRVWDAAGSHEAGGDMVVNGEECRARLVQWSRDLKPDKLIDRLQRRIMELRDGVQSEAVRVEIAHLTSELESLFHELSVYWRQRGKAAWMRDGDKNTSYFHARATTRKHVNKIKCLQDTTGVWVNRKADMEMVVD